MRRLKTVRRPPIYPKTPGHLPCSSLTHPLPLSSRRPSVSFGGFGIKQRFFGPVQAKELKHSALSRHPKQQEMVIELLESLKSNHRAVKIGVVHKRFALVCKSVDLIIEPAVSESGLDFYNKGFNIALSNLLFYALPAWGGTHFYSNILTRLQQMLRQRTVTAYDAFFSLVFCKYEYQELNQLLEYLRIAHSMFGYSLFDMIDNDTLDIGLTFALRNMARWREETSESIYLIHDGSSTMSKQQKIWNALMDPSLPPEK